jgi:hypothetical protein
MNTKNNTYIKSVIDHFVYLYKLDLSPYNKAYRIWFDNKLYSEIIIDFLKRLHMPANVRLRITPTITADYPYRIAYISLDDKNPIFFLSSQFKRTRFEICIDPSACEEFELFICALIHELSHLVLYSTHNKYRNCEVATDLLVMASGLYEEGHSLTRCSIKGDGYITNEQIQFAYKYIREKKEIKHIKWFSKFFSQLKLQLFS